MWEGAGDWTELQHIDPHSYGHNSVSFPFSWAAQPGARGPSLSETWSSFQHLLSNCNCSIGGLRAPSAGCWFSLPHLISNSSDLELTWSPTGLISNSLTSCLHPGYIIIWRPLFFLRASQFRTHSTRPRSRLYPDIPWPDAPVIYTGAFPILTAWLGANMLQIHMLSSELARPEDNVLFGAENLTFSWSGIVGYLILFYFHILLFVLFLYSIIHLIFYLNFINSLIFTSYPFPVCIATWEVYVYICWDGDRVLCLPTQVYDIHHIYDTGLLNLWNTPESMICTPSMIKASWIYNNTPESMICTPSMIQASWIYNTPPNLWYPHCLWYRPPESMIFLESMICTLFMIQSPWIYDTPASNLWNGDSTLSHVYFHKVVFIENIWHLHFQRPKVDSFWSGGLGLCIVPCIYIFDVGVFFRVVTILVCFSYYRNKDGSVQELCAKLSSIEKQLLNCFCQPKLPSQLLTFVILGSNSWNILERQCGKHKCFKASTHSVLFILYRGWY